MATNVPIPTLGDAGFTAPAESDILAGVFADLQAAFGGGLNTNFDTPQGQLATSLAAIIGATNDLFAFYVNQVDPAYASGRMQDAIARIYFLTRQPPLATTVTCTCVGAAGTIIPAGALALATDGNIYESSQTVTIPSGGSIDVSFAAINTGPIECPAGSVVTIYRSVPGWDAVSNASAGIVGRDVETRVQFEARRSASVALNAVGVLPAVRAAVLNTAGVTDAYVTENATGADITVNGVTIAARSLYVAAVGGTDLDVATSIWRKKNPGCGYTGSTTVTVTDSQSGYTAPLPSYAVSFTRPAALPIYWNVELSTGPDVPNDALTQVQNAIESAFYGEDGGTRATIGAKLYASRFYGAIAALGPWVRIETILIGTTSPGAANDVQPTIAQIPTFDPGHVTLTLV